LRIVYGLFLGRTFFCFCKKLPLDLVGILLNLQVIFLSIAVLTVLSCNSWTWCAFPFISHFFISLSNVCSFHCTNHLPAWLSSFLSFSVYNFICIKWWYFQGDNFASFQSGCILLLFLVWLLLLELPLVCWIEVVRAGVLYYSWSSRKKFF
jgi:hypothetical protein